MKEKSLLNRYVRYIYNKMKKEHGIQETREQGLRIFVITTPERARVRGINKDTLSAFSTELMDGIMALLNEWGIPTKFINDSLSVFGTPEQLEQLLLDITPIRIRIRKLTPRTCFRLMGVAENDIDAIINSGLSNSAQYKLAGNSIVTNCLMGIFTQMFRADSDSLF